VSLGKAREDYARQILDAVEAGDGSLSQRSLSRRVGIALGLTNLLLKRLIRKGWVRMIHVKPNRVMYLITPAGLTEKARMSRAYFAYTTRFYTEARDRVGHSFGLLSARWPVPTPPEKRIVLYGAGEVAEIGFLCLQDTDLRVVAVVDDRRKGSFFGIRVCPSEWLASDEARRQFEMVVVMAFSEAEVDAAQERLTALGFPPDRVFWI